MRSKVKLFGVIALAAAVGFAMAACKGGPGGDPGDPGGGVNPEVPVISAHPQGATYTVQAQAVPLTVSASVGDDGNLSYQWYYNTADSNTGGTAASGTGANTASYTPSTASESTFYYYVVVTNTLNGKTATAKSNTAKIEVNTKANAVPPSISAHPQDAEYTIGATADALTVAASKTDSGDLSYQWYSNDENSNEGGTEIENADDASYTPPTDQLGTVYYYVEVTNTISDNGDGGNKSAATTSNVAAITVTPISIDSATITVTAPAKSETPDTEAATDDEGYTCGTVTWNPVHTTFLGNTKYTASVTLTAKENHAFASDFTAKINGIDAVIGSKTEGSVTIALEFDATLNKTVSSISIETQPTNLTYTHGETLDLDGLVVKLAFDDGTDENFELDDFGTTISTVPANGTVLSHSALYNNQPITVHCGSESVNTTNNLTVSKKTLTVTGAVHTKEYDGNTSTSGISLTLEGIVGSEDVSAGTVTAVYTAANAGTTTVNITGLTLTGEDAENYTVTLPASSITVTGGGITKATPTVTWPTAATITYGQTLEAVVFTGNSGNGVFAYTNATFAPTVANSGTAYEVTFTPVDAENYYTLKQNVNITVLLGVEMVSVGAGSFEMGQNGDGSSGNITPVHQVTLSGFYMGKYEVTQEQWQAVMGNNPSYFTGNAFAGETQSRRPVERVSWYDVLVFCNKLSIVEGLTPAYRINNSTDPSAWGNVPTSSNVTWDAVTIVDGSTGYRLPTEAQWEYAAKGGSLASNPYKIYSGSDTASDVGWYDTGYRTHEVGKKAANELGLYDMSGNVTEWCWDWYNDYKEEAQTDPVGASLGSDRVSRGGNYSDEDVGNLRSVCRNHIILSQVYAQVGVRLVRPAQ